jgi:hypothetical protein
MLLLARNLVALLCVNGRQHGVIALEGLRTGIGALVFVFFLAVSTHPANAIVYTYQGNTYDQIFNPFSDPGVTPYTSNMGLSFSFELSSPLLPSPTSQFYFLQNAVSIFSFSDGAQRLDQTNSTLTSLSLWVDSSGDIAQWLMLAEQDYLPPVNVGDLARTMGSQFEFSFAGRDISTVARCQTITSNSLCGLGLVNSAFVDGAPGTWHAGQVTPPASVAEPSTLTLLVTGLGGILFIGGRRRRSRSKPGNGTHPQLGKWV